MLPYAAPCCAQLTVLQRVPASQLTPGLCNASSAQAELRVQQALNLGNGEVGGTAGDGGGHCTFPYDDIHDLNGVRS